MPRLAVMKRLLPLLPLALAMGCATADNDLVGPSTGLIAGDSVSLKNYVKTISDSIAVLRGMPFKQTVQATWVTRADLPALFDSFDSPADTANDPASTSFGQLCYGLGFTTSPGSYDSGEASFEGSSIAGFYVSGTNHLWIVTDASTSDLAATIAHELVHALQDQYFGLDKPRATTLDGQRAQLAVIEGDAEYTSLLYEYGNPSFATIDAKWNFRGIDALYPILMGLEDYASMPLVNTLPTYIPYTWGPGFVHTLRKTGGWSLVNTFQDIPPLTTHHVLQPSLAIGHSLFKEWDTTKTFPATARLGNWTPLGFDRMGDLLLSTLVMTWKTGGTNALTGWNGDRFWLWRKDSLHYAAAGYTSWESESEATFFKARWDAATAGAPGTRLFRSVRKGSDVLLAWGHMEAPEMDSLWKDVQDSATAKLVAGRTTPGPSWPRIPVRPWGPRPPRF